jgi:hypothetical protein
MVSHFWARFIERSGFKFKFDWGMLSPIVRTSFGRNGFLEHFGLKGGPTGGNAVAFRQDMSLDKDSLLPYLTQGWIGTGRVIKRLKDCSVDGYDVFFLEAMKLANISKVVTDDADFGTVEGINVYTCNQTLISEAKNQGRLTE